MAAHETVVAGAPEDLQAVRAGGDGVVASVAQQSAGPVTEDAIVSISPREGVQPARASDQVVARPPGQSVRRPRAADDQLGPVGEGDGC